MTQGRVREWISVRVERVERVVGVEVVGAARGEAEGECSLQEVHPSVRSKVGLLVLLVGTSMSLVRT